MYFSRHIIMSSQYIYIGIKSLTVQEKIKLSAFGFRLLQSQCVFTGKNWKKNENRYIYKMKQNNTKMHKNHIKCVKVDTTVCSVVGIRLEINR